MSFEDWMNPPPPGTTDDLPLPILEKYECKKSVLEKSRDKYSSDSSERSYDRYSYRSRSRSRDRRDYKRSKGKYRSQSRDRSRSRDRRRRSRSRSSSRKRYDNHKRSHRSRRSRYSRSRSRSRSRHHRKSYSRSRSPSYHKRSRSTSNSSSDSSYQKRSSKISTPPKNFDDSEEIYDEPTPVQENTFKNDGSFLEMFKKMQEQMQAQQAQTSKPTPPTTENPPTEKKSIPIFGKRRGGRILKTGVVQKNKNTVETENEPKDAWSVYMQEVRKYKEACCDDDSKTRPLVK